MRSISPRARRASVAILASLLSPVLAQAAPTISRLTPPSRPTSGFGAQGAVIARFLPGQRFDLQSTVRPEEGKTITGVQFLVDGKPVANVTGSTGNVSLVTTGLMAGLPAGTAVASVRAYSSAVPGVHTLRVVATQSDSTTATRDGVFEIVKVSDKHGKRARNVIVMIGDGMGIAHRTAARILLRGLYDGKANSPLAMDTFPFTAAVTTSSLNSIVTDSSPGAHCYATGNKANNNQEGVFPDDTTDAFDNPRIENIGEFLFRTQGKTLGIVTTADVFDATPAAFGVHTSNRGAGTGIIDQYLLEAVKGDGSGPLRVLMGGGRKWFLGSETPGSARTAALDYTLPADIATGWGVAAGASDPATDLIPRFQSAGFAYASDKKTLDTAGIPDRLLGLFHLGNMNIALDKIAKRRGSAVGNVGGKNGERYVVDDYGFPDQPMLDEMAAKAMAVMNKNPKGFVMMIEGASIDKQAHEMDSDRWLLDTIEFDRAIKVVQDFAAKNPDTLVIVTADHETGGSSIIGASKVTDSDLQARAQGNADQAAAIKNLRDDVVGTYESAGFPQYSILADGYPSTTDPDHKLLIGYGANADRYEDWLTDPMPLAGTTNAVPGADLGNYPTGPTKRDAAGNLLFYGQVPGATAVHTASDILLSAYGRGSSQFTGVLDNTDIFFRVMQALTGGAN